MNDLDLILVSKFIFGFMCFQSDDNFTFMSFGNNVLIFNHYSLSVILAALVSDTFKGQFYSK